MTAITFDNVVAVLADSFFGGDTNVASLAIMLAVFLVFVVILANVKAPPVYALVPLIPLALMFAALGVLSVNLSMLIIVLASVFTAMEARNIATGR